MRVSQLSRIWITSCALTLAAVVSQAQCFGKQTQVFSNIFPWDIVTTDFNHDGIPDLAIATLSSDHSQGAVSFVLGVGDGTFRKAGRRYFAIAHVSKLATGDFNNDGNPDVIAVDNDYSNAPQGINIFLGYGDGTFQNAIHREADYLLDDVAVGDFNGDGKLDAVVSSHDFPFLGVYMGNGDGSLVGPFSISGVPGSTWTLMTGDYNGDGISDIALNVRNGIEVEIANGDGTFHASGLYPTIRSIAATQGDFNNDGFVDFAVGSGSRLRGLDVLLGNGDGTFQVPIANDFAPTTKLAVADFNGDGQLDLVTSPDHVHRLTIQLGNGDGTFQAGITQNAPGEVIAIAATDFNGDGLADLALGTLWDPNLQAYNVAILPNLNGCQ